jgi:hypothetical protein
LKTWRDSCYNRAVSDEDTGAHVPPETKGDEPPKVFISYSHDSAEHKERVLRFAHRLRKDGIDAQIDQYVKGRPLGGWPRWMLDKLDWADFVLLVCTEIYYRRFRGQEPPDVGKGVDWEGQLITLEIYRAKSRTAKFLPIIFRSEDTDFIPETLSDQFYILDSEDRYGEVYAALTGQVGVPVPELGQPIRMPKKVVEPLTFGTQSGAPPDTRVEKLDVLVLMPSSTDLIPVYEDHIMPTCASMELTVRSVVDFFPAGSVIQEIRNAILSARLIVADCTGRNPNVFYELGMAHAMEKATILLTQSTEDVPFDLRVMRYIAYQLTPRGMREFEVAFKETVRNVLKIDG